MMLTPRSLEPVSVRNHFLPADVEMAINEAARGQVRRPSREMLAFCYVADPQGRGYVFSVTRAVAPPRSCSRESL